MSTLVELFSAYFSFFPYNEMVSNVEIWPYYQMVYAQPRIRPGELNTQNSLGFLDTNRWPNSDQKTRSCDSYQKNRTYRIVEFVVLVDHCGKRKERSVLRPCQRTKKSCETWGRQAGKGGKRSTSGNNPDYNIDKIGQNTEKSPGDLGRLAVTQTPGKDNQLTPTWKTCKE